MQKQRRSLTITLASVMMLSGCVASEEEEPVGTVEHALDIAAKRRAAARSLRTRTKETLSLAERVRTVAGATAGEGPEAALVRTLASAAHTSEEIVAVLQADGPTEQAGQVSTRRYGPEDGPVAPLFESVVSDIESAHALVRQMQAESQWVDYERTRVMQEASLKIEELSRDISGSKVKVSQKNAEEYGYLR